MKRMSQSRLMLAALPILALTAGAASAQDGGLAGLFTSVTTNLRPAINMIMIAAFLGGVFFAISAMLKMKDAKENPRDNSAGTITLNWVAAIFLIFLGGGIAMMRETLGVDANALTGSQTVTYSGQ